MFHFEIYDYPISLDSTNLPKAVGRVQKDFSYFVKTSAHLLIEPKLIIRGYPLSSAPQKSGFPLWKTRMCQIFQNSWSTRTCIYKFDGKVTAILQHRDLIQHKEIDLYCDNEDLFCEIIHMLILSSCGEFFEQKGLMRLHAAVLLYQETSFVFWGHRGAGKSTLAYHLMNLPEVKLLTDEHGLFDLNTNQLLPFPLRLALDSQIYKGQTLKRFFLDQKNTVEIPVEKQTAASLLNQFIVLGKKSGTSSKIEYLSLFQKISLFFNIVLGIGLIQMSEFMLRPTSIISLVKIFTNRLKLFFKILNTNLYYWKRSSDLQANLLFCQKLFIIKK